MSQLTPSTTMTKIAATRISCSALWPAIVDRAVPRKKPNKKLMVNKDKRRQGLRNTLTTCRPKTLKSSFRRVFCVTLSSRSLSVLKLRVNHSLHFYQIVTISVEFIEGMSEEISGISLRKRPNSDTKIVVLSFERLVAAEGFKSFGNKVEYLWLKDEEGNIQVSPQGIKFIFVDDDELSKAECTFEVHSQDQFDRVMRFFHRYADAHGFEFQGN